MNIITSIRSRMWLLLIVAVVAVLLLSLLRLQDVSFAEQTAVSEVIVTDEIVQEVIEVLETSRVESIDYPRSIPVTAPAEIASSDPSDIGSITTVETPSELSEEPSIPEDADIGGSSTYKDNGMPEISDTTEMPSQDAGNEETDDIDDMEDMQKLSILD